MKETNKVRINFIIEKDTIDKFKELAKARGLSVSAWIRLFMFQEIAKDKAEGK